MKEAIIQKLKEAEINNKETDVVLAELLRRVRADLEENTFDSLEVSDVNGKCLEQYYYVQGYEGEVRDIIKQLDFDGDDD